MQSMQRCTLVGLLACVPMAQAADTKATVDFVHTDFGGAFGQRRLVNAELADKSGANTFVLGASAGTRDFGAGGTFDGTRLSGTWYRDWTHRISTRTSATAGSDDPVFVNRAFDQDVTFKAFPRTTLTAGARHSDYFGGADATAWYLAGAYYIDRLIVRYRYTHHDLPGVGGSHGRLLSFRYKDGQGGGFTQAWFGQGTTLEEYDWTPVAQAGGRKSIALRRTHPLTSRLALNVGVERLWFDTPVGDYTGSTGTLGLTVGW